MDNCDLKLKQNLTIYSSCHELCKNTKLLQSCKKLDDHAKYQCFKYLVINKAFPAGYQSSANVLLHSQILFQSVWFLSTLLRREKK